MPLPSHGATKASRGPQLLWVPSPRRACVLPTPHPRSPFLRHVTPRLDQSVTLSLDSFPMTTIDKDALQLKYAEERAKRLRPDGNDQYVELEPLPRRAVRHRELRLHAVARGDGPHAE